MLSQFSQVSVAKDYKVGDLTIANAWARASAGQARTGAAYIGNISNHGNKMDRLISATSPVAKRVEIHNNIIENGVAKMRQVTAIDINPGHPIALKPGGYHIMFMGLHAPLKIGETFPLTLSFEHAGKIDLAIEVRKIGSSRSMNMKHGKMKH
jgi:periplasmic copper chaperone A